MPGLRTGPTILAEPPVPWGDRRHRTALLLVAVVVAVVVALAIRRRAVEALVELVRPCVGGREARHGRKDRARSVANHLLSPWVAR